MTYSARVLPFLVVLISLASACTFDAAGLEARRCRSNDDCTSATQSCLGGFCQDDDSIVGGNNGADAGPDADLDAGNNGQDDAGNNGQDDASNNGQDADAQSDADANDQDATNNGQLCTTHADCDDGLFCNGSETCDPLAANADADGCLAGVPPVAEDDGNDCTDPACDETLDSVYNATTDRCTCDTPGALCADAAPNDCTIFRCSEALTCVRENAPLATACNDGVRCTTNDNCSANGTCAGTPSDAICDNMAFCDGTETCAPTAPTANADGCVPGQLRTEDDLIACTVDVCNEANDAFDHIPSGCGCTMDADCVPAIPNTCLTYTCGADQQCTSTPKADTTACEDGFTCTTGDHCDGAGGCVATPSDAGCDDNAFCNGVETCNPINASANAAGCVAGQPPTEDDNIACTNDVCNETNDAFDHISNGCGCLVDADCVPANPDACLRYTCGADRQCTTGPQPDTAPCEDAFSCTTQDHCDGLGACVGTPTDAACNDTLYCNGVETCAPADANANAMGCVAGAPPIDSVSVPACAVPACNEDTDAIDVDSSLCECAVNADCTDPCLQTPTCVAGRCIGTIIVGSTCTMSCANNDGGSMGTCTEQGCVLPPEGPTGVASCEDSRDNDCDGAVDAADTDCFTADEVVLVADSTATTGLDSAGASLLVGPALSSVGATHQDANLYCTGRIRRRHLDLAALRTNALPPDVTLGNTTDIRTDERWDDTNNSSARGIELCEGNNLVFGPIPMPPNGGATKYTLAVHIRMGNQGVSANELSGGEYLVVSVKHSTTGSKFLPLIGIGDGEDHALGDYGFLIPNTAADDSLQLRLEIMTDDGSYNNTCAFIQSIDVFDVRNPTIGTQTDWVQWTVNGVEDDAVETFVGETSPYFNTFFASKASGVDFVATVEGNAASDGDGKGAKYRTDESGGMTGGRTGWVNFPVPTGPPANYDRANPLMFDLNLRTERTEWDEDEWGHVVLSVAGGAWRRLASAVPTNIASSTYAVSYTPENRYSMILPEDAKPLDLTLRLDNDSYSSTDERLQVDYIHFYSYTGHADDIAITAIPSAAGDDTYDFTVHSARAGDVVVECVWQVPADGTFPTVRSTPAVITFAP